MQNSAQKNILLSIISIALFGTAFLQLGNYFKMVALANENTTTIATTTTTEDEMTEDEKILLEKKAEDLTEKEKILKKKLDKRLRQKKELEQGLSQIQGAVYNTQRAINATESEIEKTRSVIERKNKDIELFDKKIDKNKKSLAEMMQEVRYNAEQPFLYIILDRNNFLESALNIDYFLNTKKEILSLIKKLKNNQDKLEKDKKELEGEKEKHQKLLNLKEDQKRVLNADKYKLKVAVNEKNADIKKIQAKLAKVKNNLNSLLGKSFNVSDIEQAAKLAGKATGVRKDFLMGMLVVETDLGRYTGGCNYKESRMNSYRKGVFKDICKELGYNYKKMKVSCPPSGYKGTGGAMGVAQFMSDTWLGYKSKIAANTGHNPPDPWSLGDGVMAMALKLARDGATSKSGECRAAMRYLGGSHQWYCDKVLYWADNYEKKL